MRKIVPYELYYKKVLLTDNTFIHDIPTPFCLSAHNIRHPARNGISKIKDYISLPDIERTGSCSAELARSLTGILFDES